MGCWGFHQPLASLSIIQQMGRTINGTAEHSRASRNHVPQNIVLTAHSEHWPGNFRWQFSHEKSPISDTLRHKKVPKDRPRRWRKRNILSFPPLSAPREAELYSHQIIETLRLSSLHPIITYILYYIILYNICIHLPIETVRKCIWSCWAPSLWGITLSSQLIQTCLEVGSCLLVRARKLFETYVYIYTHILCVYIYNILLCIDRCIIYLYHICVIYIWLHVICYICIRVCRYLYIYILI